MILFPTKILTMTPDTYTFTGDFTTFLGLVGVVSTGIIIVTAFRRFFNSPMNVRVTPTKLAQDPAQDSETPVS